MTQPEAVGDKGKYLEEVEKVLSQDKTRLGDVWRHHQKGLNANEIAKELDVGTAGFVYNNRHFIKAIEEGKVPSSPSIARQCASALRGFAKRHEASLSPETVKEIEKRAVKCDNHANDPALLERQTSAAEKEGVPGIYVYTRPHYYLHPVAPADKADKKAGANDRTYLKVGKSEKDAIKRVRAQQTTALPERLYILRVYTCSNGMDIAEVEKKIHSHLEAADHFKNSERGAGTEWFLTHEKFLDSTADLDLKNSPSDASDDD